ncbi:MAG: phosphoglycerate mutase family protein, partial [Planctomycetia bacterium]|nr:phosphoglycerate mutase family protein [Planctomycetia bacterium]
MVRFRNSGKDPGVLSIRAPGVDSGKIMIFYCVRHGESVYNQAGRIQGWLDVPLSSLGESQAESAAMALVARFDSKPDTREIVDGRKCEEWPRPERIFASPLQRAWRTGEYVSER